MAIMDATRPSIEAKAQRRRLTSGVLLLVAFFISLAAISLAGLAGFDEKGDLKKIAHSLKPKRMAKKFPFRDYLIQAHDLLLFSLNVPPNEKAILGKDNYLFYYGESADNGEKGIVPNQMINEPLAPDELEHMVTSLDRLAKGIKGKGITFLFLIIPDKQTVFPERLPSNLLPFAEVTRREQFISYFTRTHPQENYVLDLTTLMQSHKGDGQLYYKTDTHWTDLAAHYAYKAIMDKLKEIDGVPRDSQHIVLPTETRILVGDIASNVMKLGHRVAETVTATVPNPCFHYKDLLPIERELHPIHATCPSGLDKKLVIMGDSFFDHSSSLWQYVAGTFRQTTSFHHPVVLNNPWEDEKPNIVIVETVERGLSVTLRQIDKLPLP